MRSWKLWGIGFFAALAVQSAISQGTGWPPVDTYNINYEANRNFTASVEVKRFTQAGIKMSGTNEKFDIEVKLGVDVAAPGHSSPWTSAMRMKMNNETIDIQFQTNELPATATVFAPVEFKRRIHCRRDQPASLVQNRGHLNVHCQFRFHASCKFPACADGSGS